MNERTTPDSPPGQAEARDAFHGQLLQEIPRLRLQARTMARNSADAEDLVQGALANALAARGTFAPGTNFGGWMHRILRNLFLANIRRRPKTCDLDEVPDERLAYPAGQLEGLVLDQLRRDLARLPAELREALALVAVEALPYDAAAEIAGCPVGTMKSRVFRARRHLDACLAGEEAAPQR